MSEIIYPSSMYLSVYLCNYVCMYVSTIYPSIYSSLVSPHWNVSPLSTGLCLVNTESQCLRQALCTYGLNDWLPVGLQKGDFQLLREDFLEEGGLPSHRVGPNW